MGGSSDLLLSTSPRVAPPIHVLPLISTGSVGRSERWWWISTGGGGRSKAWAAAADELVMRACEREERNREERREGGEAGHPIK
jgi:hypothetical protein